MTTATIQITPRTFGNIAAAAMAHGCDVTTYLVRTALTSAPQRAAATTTAAPATTPAPEQPAPVHQPAPAGSSGMFDTL